MKLWILKPIDDNAGHWQGHWDSVFGFVVRAESEELARKMVNPEGQDENRKHNDVWLDPALTTCVELSAGGLPAIIMTDFCNG